MRIKSAYRPRLQDGSLVLAGGPNPILAGTPVPDDVLLDEPEVHKASEHEPNSGMMAAALQTAARYSSPAPNGSLRDAAALEASNHSRAAAMFSAPVSREVPSSNPLQRPGRLTLTAAQREAEYALNVLRLQEAKRADPDRYGS
jgi:hypothetical protein